MAHAPRELKEIARATIEVAMEERAVARVIHDIKQVTSALESDRMIAIELSNQVFDLACGAMLHPVAKNALAALIRRGLISELHAFCQRLILAAREYARHEEIRVTSALPLLREERSRLIKFLETKFNGSVALEERTNASHLGGLLIESAGWTVDATTRGKLERLHEALLT